MRDLDFARVMGCGTEGKVVVADVNRPFTVKEWISIVSNWALREPPSQSGAAAPPDEALKAHQTRINSCGGG
jgi:hypothetical protein